VFLCTTVLLAGALAGTWIYVARLKQAMAASAVAAMSAATGASGPVSPLLVHYRLDMPGRGEIFPSLSGDAPENFPVAVLTIANTSERPLIQTVTAQVPGWSRQLEQTLVVGRRETRRVDLNLELLARAYANTEIRRADLEVRVSDPAGGSDFAQTRRVFLHDAWDLYWGEKFSNAQYVARWVMPHDAAVLRLVSQARRFVPRGRLAGYDQARPAAQQAREVRRQAEAVFEALRRSGLSYVNSLFTFGDLKNDAQRIRSPEETLTLHAANCIDVSVAFASAMENLGLDPVIVIVPGHAFTGVRLRPGSPQILYLDLTVLPNGTFAAADARAQGWLRKTPANQVLTVDIAAARALGIYPMPQETAVAASAAE
jgi:hypothetical protein